MSAYIDFYLKDQKNDFYLPLLSVSRSNEIFQAFEDYVSYGVLKPLSLETLYDVESDLNRSIDSYKSMIRTAEKAMKFLENCNVPLEERLEPFYAEQNTIEECTELIKEAEKVLALVNTLELILRDMDWRSSVNAEEYIWVGMETGNPNEPDD